MVVGLTLRLSFRWFPPHPPRAHDCLWFPGVARRTAYVAWVTATAMSFHFKQARRRQQQPASRSAFATDNRNDDTSRWGRSSEPGADSAGFNATPVRQELCITAAAEVQIAQLDARPYRKCCWVGRGWRGCTWGGGRWSFCVCFQSARECEVTLISQDSRFIQALKDACTI